MAIRSVLRDNLNTSLLPGAKTQLEPGWFSSEHPLFLPNEQCDDDFVYTVQTY